jgi:hypothetical protein
MKKNIKSLLALFLVVGIVLSAQIASAALRNPFNGFGSSSSGASARFTVASSGGDYTSLGAAVTAACAASPAGGTIFVKSGTYTQTSAITGCTNLRITLDQSATIQVNGATVPTLFAATSGSSRIIIEGGKFLQTNATAQGTALDMSNLANTWIKNVRIEEFGLGILYSDSANTTFYNNVSDSQIFNSNNCVEYSGTQANNNNIFNLRCRPKAGGAGIGLKLVDARGISVYGSDFEPATAAGITGVSIDATSRETLISGTWIENNATGLLIASGANRVTLNGNSITSNTTDISDAGTNTQFMNTNRTGALVSNFIANIPNSFNKVALVITQADVTNNPAAATITNTGTGNGLTITEASGGNVYSFTTPTTGDDPIESFKQARVATTDATVTTIATITIPTTTTVDVEATITARRTGGASGTAEDGASYMRSCAWKNVAGTATQIGSTATITTMEDQAGWDVTCSATAGTGLIQVTGASANNVTWHVTYKTHQLSS